MRRALVVPLLVALCVGVASIAFAEAWRNHRYDAAHTASNASEVINPRKLELRWSKFIGNAGGSIWSLPVVSQGRFFVGMSDGSVQWLKAFRLSNGKALWKRVVATPHIPTGPVTDGTRVFIAGDNPRGHIDAYSLHGTFLWTSDPTGIQGSVRDSPVVAGSLVYLAAAGVNGDIYAFRIADGTEAWHQPVLAGSGGAPTVAGGRVFATYPGKHYAFDALDGSLLWHNDLGAVGGGGSTPTATTSIVYMVDADWSNFPFPDTVFAYDAATGAEIWRRTYPLGNVPELALRSDALMVVDGVRMEALDPATGNVEWFFDPDTDLQYPPVVAGNVIFVASASKTYAVSATQHNQLWSVNVGGKVVVAEGWVLITNSSGSVHAYNNPAP